VSAPRRPFVDPAETARHLQWALADDGVNADVHAGFGLALVSVWVGLVVWCDGELYWWRTGWNSERKRVIYARHSAGDPLRAARRVAFQYAELRKMHPLSGVISAVVSETKPASGNPL